jgi:hypothetical protein
MKQNFTLAKFNGNCLLTDFLPINLQQLIIFVPCHPRKPRQLYYFHRHSLTNRFPKNFANVFGPEEDTTNMKSQIELYSRRRGRLHC